MADEPGNQKPESTNRTIALLPVGMSIGTVVGVPFGTALDHRGLGIAIGIAVVAGGGGGGGGGIALSVTTDKD